MEITNEEQKAINSLNRLAKKWPETLWLFAGAGSLYVMKLGEDGLPVITEFGGVNPEYIVGRIDIFCDGGGGGGDWD